MKFELQFVCTPKPQPVIKEDLSAASVGEAKVKAKQRLEEMVYKLVPTPDAVIVVNAETRELIDVIERGK